MKERIKRIAVVPLIVAVAFGAAFVGARFGGGNSPEPGPAAAETQPQNIGDNIAIPGYDVIRLKAHKTEQSVYLCNPEQNHCFFVISLLCDGAEVFKSGMMPPNAKAETITLTQPLEAGSYENAIVRYACYDLYTQRELNGAEIAIRLEVE